MDFWASSGFRLLERGEHGLIATDAWLARFLDRDELRPPDDAGPHERALHRRIAHEPRTRIEARHVAALEDADARENWIRFLAFRDRLLEHPSLEGCYLDLFSRDVDLAPAF